MPKYTEYQYTYKKQISFTQQQKEAFEILRKHGVNINQFVRQATKEKIQREWKGIKQNQERIKNAPDWLYD